MGAGAILEAVGIRVALPVLLRALPLDRVLATLTPGRAPATAQAGSLESIAQATDFVTRDLPLTRTACLKRALMRYRMLRRRGHEARFHIGVRPGGEDGFEAHAWVTIEGAPVMEREAIDYRPTFVWPPCGDSGSVTESVTGPPREDQKLSPIGGPPVG